MFSFSGGVAIRALPGQPERERHALPQRPADGLTPSSTRPARARTRTTTSSSAARPRSWSGPLRLGLRGAGVHGRASAAPAARSSSTSTGRTTRACSTPAIPQYSYPDMVTQTIHVGDCELLERWLDSKVLAEPALDLAHLGQPDADRGPERLGGDPEPVRSRDAVHADARVSECISGWRGLSPLALNPNFGTAPGYDPAVHGPVEWTHWGDLVNIYGDRRDGLRALAVGQRGRPVRARRRCKSGAITPAAVPRPERERRHVEGARRTWCRRAARTSQPSVRASRRTSGVRGTCTSSPDGGATPAPRHEGDRKAQYAAYRSGMVFRGKLDIPVIDWRHYLEPLLDMHNSHQSFAARQRLLNYDGDASNQVIWFTAVPAPGAGVRFDQTPQALLVLDRWLANIADHPERAWPGTSRPTQSTPASTWTGRCLHAAGTCGTGSSTPVQKGECAAAFPPFGTSRTVAGGPIEGGIFKCRDAVRAPRNLARSVRVLASDRGRARPVGADLPVRCLRLPEAGRGLPPRVPARPQSRTRERAAASGGRPRTSGLSNCCAFVKRLTPLHPRRSSSHEASPTSNRSR